MREIILIVVGIGKNKNGCSVKNENSVGEAEEVKEGCWILQGKSMYEELID